MTEPKTTSGVAPLTTEEQATLQALQERQAAAARDAAEAEKASKLEGMASAKALVVLLRKPAVTDGLAAAMADPALDFDTKLRLQNFKTALDYNIGAIEQTIANLQPAT